MNKAQRKIAGLLLENELIFWGCLNSRLVDLNPTPAYAFRMKTIVAVFLSFLGPPVGFSLVGEWKKGFVLLGIVLFFGWLYSLGGSLGPIPFYLTLILAVLAWASVTLISIRHVLRNKNRIRFWKGSVAWLLAFIAVHVCREFLYLGSPFRLTNNSMAPGIEYGQHFFLLGWVTPIK
jgi:hypothetical protein